ncbi:transposase family protein [Pararoseomonas sp. SCSIO 73927]|uniref:integrase catalytic domain-containing protein n=1 Tax=Pararoseomonas sp. SCSIO 73927 TaxID=3114537 RepID=UPI0030D2BDD4
MTPSVTILPGQMFVYGGATIAFRYRAKDADRSYVFEDENRIPYALPPDEVILARAEDRLRDWSGVSVATVGGDRQIRRARVTYDSATEKERFLVERAHEYVMEWVNNQHVPRTDKELKKLCEVVHARRVEKAAKDKRKFAEPLCMSGSRLRQLIRIWKMGGEKADAIVTQQRFRGNYRTRLSATVTEIMWQVTDAIFLKLNGVSIAKLHRAIGKEIEKKNADLAPEARHAEPSYEAVNAHVKRICAYTLVFCREGKTVADERFRLDQGGWLTTHANEIWEIDDTRVDLICLGKDGKTVIGRPWLTFVIDRHTRMIMSYVLTFSPPDTETALEAVRLAMLPKKFFSGREPGLGKFWPAQGRPDEIHVDQGKPYNSKGFKASMMRLGIPHHTLPRLKAWYKGTVERVFGTAMREVFHLVAGSTRSNFYDRDADEIAPELVAEATLEEAEIKLLGWLLNEYMRRPHRGIQDTPLNMWERSMKDHDQRMPLTRADIINATSLSVGRRIRRGGIVVDELRYLTPHGLRMEMKATSPSDREVVVRRDPGDLTTISFLDARVTELSEERWHVATICPEHRPRVEGLTLLEYRLARALRRQNPDAFANDDPEWTSAREAARQTLEDDAASPKLTDRVRAEGRLEKKVKQAEYTVARLNEVAEGPTGDDLQSTLGVATPAKLPSSTDPVPPATSGKTSTGDGAVSAEFGKGLSVRRRDGKPR